LKFIFILFLSFFSFCSAKDAMAAEKINIKFEEMSIPLTIDQLLNLENYKNDSTELIDWFKQNDFLKVFEISRFLKFPVFKEESCSERLLIFKLKYKFETMEIMNIAINENSKFLNFII